MFEEDHRTGVITENRQPRTEDRTVTGYWIVGTVNSQQTTCSRSTIYQGDAKPL